MINEELFTTLAARQLAGEATPAELQELEVLLQEHTVLQERYLILQQYFKESAYHSTSDTEQALQRTLSKIQSPSTETGLTSVITVRRTRFLRVIKWTAAAAAILLMFGISYLYPFKQGVKQVAAADTAQWLQRENGKATRAVIELADGSKIWLNADSKLTYPEVFSATSREVYLAGEAFFDVAGNPRKPFIIHLEKGTIKVLGTSFNIRAYDNEPVQTSVKTGKVAFIPKYEDAGKKADTIFITPDEKVIYKIKDAAASIVKEITSAEDDKAWTEGRLVFRDVTLEEISMELERTFGKKIVFTSEAPKHYHLTGSFQNNNLQDIMYYLARSKTFHYTITDSTLLIGE